MVSQDMLWSLQPVSAYIYLKDRLKVKCLMTTQVVIRTFRDPSLDGCLVVDHRTSVKFARSIAEVGERKK